MENCSQNDHAYKRNNNHIWLIIIFNIVTVSKSTRWVDSQLMITYLTVESLTVLQDNLIWVDSPLPIHRSVKQDWDYINVEYVNHLVPFRSQANAVYTLGKSFTIIHRVSYYIYKFTSACRLLLSDKILQYSSSSYLHYSITLNIKETAHIYLSLFPFLLREIIDIVRIQCRV